MSARRNVLLAPLLILPVVLLMMSMTPVDAAPRNRLSTTLSQSDTVQKCGRIVVAHGNLLNPAQARLVATCFWHAFQQCNSASLVFTKHSVDTGIIRTLLVSKQSGSCNIRDTVEHYIAPRPPFNKHTYTCSGVIKQSDELIVTACGADGNVVIPFA